MAVKTAAQAAQNWQQGFGAAGQKWAQGVQNTTVNPMALAAAQLPKAIANYTAAAQPGGAMATGLAAAQPSYWKSQCAAASGKLAQGATKGAAKYAKAAGALQPSWQQASDAAAQARASGQDSLSVFAASMAVMKASKGAGK